MGDRGLKDWFLSVQFAIWSVVGTVVVVLVGLPLAAYDVSPLWAYAAGLFVAIPLERFRDRLGEWHEAQRELENEVMI